MNRQRHARRLLKIPEPVLEFRVQPERAGGQCFAVRIFRTTLQMRRYLKHIRPDRDHSEDWAFTDERTCTMVFSLHTCTDNCVAHEMFHATLWWAYGMRLHPELIAGWDTAAHERCAEAHGSMVSQFWKQFSKSFSRHQCWGMERKKTSS